MKTNLLLTLTIAVLLALFAITFSSFKTQSPALINYQAVVRDANGSLITSGSVSLGISIHDAITGGNQLYFETHSVSPNSVGVVNVLIGGGSVLSGNFLMINWGSGTKFMQIYVNNNPVGNRTQLVSVFYSLYANQAGKADSTAYATNAAVANNVNLPGTIVAYGGTTPPTGWLLCDGTSYSVNQYPNLYAVIGANFGGQPGVFNVPDFRGRFLRMVDGIAGNDPDTLSRTASNIGGLTGNNVGSLQTDNFKSHIHPMSWSANGFGPVCGIGGTTQVNCNVSFGCTPVREAGGTETRPKNVYVNYIIKY